MRPRLEQFEIGCITNQISLRLERRYFACSTRLTSSVTRNQFLYRDLAASCGKGVVDSFTACCALVMDVGKHHLYGNLSPVDAYLAKQLVLLRMTLCLVARTRNHMGWLSPWLRKGTHGYSA